MNVKELRKEEVRKKSRNKTFLTNFQIFQDLVEFHRKIFAKKIIKIVLINFKSFHF